MKGKGSMDFLDMNFNELFMKKHGKKVFNQIKNQIIQECFKQVSNEYIETIFKIAYLNFWGLSNSIIKQIIKDVLPNQQINVQEIQNIHKKSIYYIQKYLQLSIL